MNEDSLKEFVSIFFSDQLLFILLVVLAIVLIILIVYLIKVEKSEKTESSEENQLKTDILSESKPNEIQMDMFNSIMPSNDEENAIISADELLKASQNLSDTLNMNSSEIIDMYEEEQEKKAIISYDELLKNAASLNIKYEEPKLKEETEPVIKKIEVNENGNYVSAGIESTNKVLSYVEEEEFLKILKQFRMDIET